VLKSFYLGVSSFALMGCASTQLNYNTLDVASTIDSLYVKQTLNNLSKFIDNGEALPSQIDVAAGTIQTSNSIAPAVTGVPLTNTVVRTGVGAVMSSSHSGAAVGVTASDSWQQSWTIAPITDGDSLRNLRALYRYVVVDGASLLDEYKPALIATAKGNFQVDPYALRPPHCVLCSTPPKSAKLKVNENLHKGWLYWESDLGSSIPPRLTPEGAEPVDLGHFGNHELFMTRRDYQAGYLYDFVLFIMGSGAGPSPPSVGGGAAKTGGGAGSVQKRFDLIIPQQINPQIQ
jgi:hypothetical protein